MTRTALVRGMTERRGLLCLIGEAGTGKTLLLHHLLAEPPPGIRLALLPHPGRDVPEIADHVAAELGLVPAGAANAVSLLHAGLAGRNVVVLADEAQAAAPETLRELPTLIHVGDGGGALQVLLAGQPGLEVAIGRAGLDDRVAVRARLEPLGWRDGVGYIRTRLAHAGATGADVFTADAISAVMRATRGVPRLIDTLCDASLVIAFDAGAATVTAEHVATAWAGYLELGATAAPIAGSVLDQHPVAAPAQHPRGEPVLPPPRGTTVPHRRAPRQSRLRLVAAAVALLTLAVTLGGRWWPATTAPPAPLHPSPAPNRPATAVHVEPPALDVPPTASEALALVDAFRRAYEARDPRRLRELLAADAVEEGRRGGLDVARAHGELLARLSQVVYVQPTARLAPRGDGMEVHAPFTIRYRDRQGRAGTLRGTARWTIARREGSPRIVALARELAPGSSLPGREDTATP